MVEKYLFKRISEVAWSNPLLREEPFWNRMLMALQSSLLHVQRCRFHFPNGEMGLSFMRLISVDVCGLLKSLCTYILFYLFKYMHTIFTVFKLPLS